MHSNQARRRLFASCLILLCALGSVRASAEPSTRDAHAAGQATPIAEARVRFARGLELYRAGDLASALAEFRRADGLAPSYRLQYNIGQVCEEQHDYACALSAFQAYLAGGGAEGPHARRVSVEQELQKLSGFVAELSVSVDVAGAEVLVDDAPVGVAPLDGVIKVNSGRRRIAARQGGLVAARSVELAGGERVSVVLTLRPEPVASQASVAPLAPVNSGASLQHERSPAVLWLWIGSGALAAGSALSGVLALRAAHQLSGERATVPVAAAELQQTSARASHWALAADVLGALAVGSAGGALYLSLAPTAANTHTDGALLTVRSTF